jgi:hypothetical protein
MSKSLPKHYDFCFLLLLCFEISRSSKFLIGGCESFENGRGFLTNVAMNACQDLATLSSMTGGQLRWK